MQIGEFKPYTTFKNYEFAHDGTISIWGILTLIGIFVVLFTLFWITSTNNDEITYKNQDPLFFRN